MRRLRLPIRPTLVASVVALLLVTAAAAIAGYLIEANGQRDDREGRLAAAAGYVERGEAQAQTTHWQHALAQKLAALRLGASLTLIEPAGKRLLYESGPLATASDQRARASINGAPANTESRAGSPQPTASYAFPVGATPGEQLALDLYSRPLDRNRWLLTALASGLAALLAGVTLLVWAAGHWLVSPLRRLNGQVDAIAGGDSIPTPVSSPVREVENVAVAVAGMATRLAQTAEQTAQLDADRSLLVSSIAHDLRTPLFSLRGYLDAIASGIGDPHERLDQAREKARQIDRLITSLFDYSRAEIDARPQLHRTDLAQAVTATATAFELAARDHGVELRVSAPAGTTVRIDRDAFDRALANVVDNALRHTPGGGTVDITAGEDEHGAYVRVTDDGPGIAPDLLPRVFEPMVRADSPPNGHARGAGLGLAIAARLIDHDHGTIHAMNDARRGAILTLRLPTATYEGGD